MNHTLTNGMNLLLFLAGSPRPHGISEIAVAVDLPKSHVHRLLQTLVEGQYVEKDSNRRYAIGVGALRLGHALLRHIPIRQQALPVMMEMVRKEAKSLTLALPFGYEAISVAFVTHDGKARETSETLGTVLSPHASASGKLFLAHLRPEKRDAALTTMDFPARGPNTHRTAESLLDDLRQIAERGYSLNDQENGRDVISLAVPIRSPDGHVVACLGTACPVADLPPDRIPALVRSLRAAADRIEHTSHPSLPDSETGSESIPADQETPI